MARARAAAQNRAENSRLSQLDREDVLKELERTGYDLRGSLAKYDVKLKTYEAWRRRYPEFRSRCEALKPGARSKPGKAYTAGFGPFQKEYLRMEPPAFHLEIIEAYESTLPGNILMVLMPPEHGKTTLFENYATMQCSLNPNWRCTVGSEKITMARKILKRIKARLEKNIALRRDFGPFRAERGSDRAEQVWAADYFDVFKAQRQEGDDERDYTMAGAGFGAAIAGTRADHLHMDDTQSLKSLRSTEIMFNEFRQDWLSRPGESGRTTINGTRVGEGDIYEAIDEAFPAEILRVVRLPAIVPDPITGEPSPLWPEMYDLEKLRRTRIKAGEEAWARNYMQKPHASGARAFDDQTIAPCLNPIRRLRHEPRQGVPSVLMLDPALGGHAATMTMQVLDTGMSIIDIADRAGLGRTEDLLGMVRDGVEWASAQGAPVHRVIIESNAMQKGLARDDRLWTMASQHGFSVGEHLTGVGKYDAAYGIPSMATDLRLGNVDIPYADEPNTRYLVDELIAQLKKWRPNVKGTILRQDLVMVMWFGWIWWRENRVNAPVSRSNFDRPGVSSYGERASGLMIPARDLVAMSPTLSGGGR